MRPANSGCVQCWRRPRKGSIQAYRIVTQCGSSFHAYRTATQLHVAPCSNTRANPHADYAPVPSYYKDLFVCICHMKCSFLLGYVINVKKCLSLCSGSLLFTHGTMSLRYLTEINSLESDVTRQVIKYYAVQVCEKDCCIFQFSNSSRRFNIPSSLRMIYDLVTVLHSTF